MKRKRLLLMILPAIIVGALVYTLYDQSTGTTQILTAKDSINAGMVITEDMLTVMEVPNTAIPKDALTNPENAVGKSVLHTRSPGDIIFRDTLSDVEEPVLKEGEAFVAVQLPAALSDMVSEGTLLTVVEHLRPTDNLPGSFQTPSVVEETEGEAEETEGTVETAETAAETQSKNSITSIENLPVYSIVQSADEVSSVKYAVVKTDIKTAKLLVNILAREHSVIISR